MSTTLVVGVAVALVVGIVVGGFIVYRKFADAVRKGSAQ
jgi:uncharacterized protein YneF (UPF0154 family)